MLEIPAAIAIYNTIIFPLPNGGKIVTLSDLTTHLLLLVSLLGLGYLELSMPFFLPTWYFEIVVISAMLLRWYVLSSVLFSGLISIVLILNPTAVPSPWC